ncbi:MAG: DinB family protein [Bacteroidota bacterium]
MSALTLPGSSSPDAVNRYRRALLDLLGDQDPRDVLASTPAACARVLEQLSPADLTAPEAPGKWSIAEVVHHLADSEVVFSNRLRRTLAEERPRLAGYDQDLWASRLGYAERAVEPSLALFEAARTANLALLDRASVDDMNRAGMHGERGAETVAEMERLYAGHDLAHRRQMDRIRARLSAR